MSQSKRTVFLLLLLFGAVAIYFSFQHKQVSKKVIEPHQELEASLCPKDIANSSYTELSKKCSASDLDALLMEYPGCAECYIAKSTKYSGYNAVSVLNTAINTIPDERKLYVYRAGLLVNNFNDNYLQDLHRAAEDYAKLLTFEPENVVYRLGRCRALSLDGRASKEDLSSASADCDYAVARSSDAMPHFFRGVIYARNGDDVAAIKEYSESIKITPSAEYQDFTGMYLPVYYFRAKIFEKLGNSDEAAKDFRLAIDHKAETKLFDELTYLYLKAGNKSGTKEILEKHESISNYGSRWTQGLWAAYYWHFDKNKEEALLRLEGLMCTDDARFEKDKYNEFLSDLYQTEEYKKLEKGYADFQGKIVKRKFRLPTVPSEIGTYKIDGTCLKKEVSGETKLGPQTYFSFDVIIGTAPVVSTLKKCSNEELSDLTEFAFRDETPEAPFKEVNTKSLGVPKKCSVLQNPGSEKKLAIIKFNESDLCMILLDKHSMPEAVLKRLSSNNSLDDGARNVEVERICDIDSDGLVEVIVRDQRYAGYFLLVNKFGGNFAVLPPESVRGLAWD